MIGFLSPALLLLGLAVAVPLILHLLQRQQGPRIVFPALRYLRRAEKENARRIKLRQILLMALRMAALILVALAAARPFIRSGGAGHEPTAVAIVLDNSLSTGLVVGDRRVLDDLKARALETLEHARPEDRFWLIRAGSPWEPAVPGDAFEVAEQVRQTEIAAGEADLDAAIARGRALLAAGADGRAAEIHLLSDLQATSFADAAPAAAGAPPVLVWSPAGQVPENAAVTAVVVGGGLAPRAGERSTVATTVAGSRAGDSIQVRLSFGDRVSAAATAPPGSEVILPFPARPAGLVSGWIELDPDALRGDDRRYFVANVRPPPTVALATAIPFVTDAVDVLIDAGRVLRGSVREAEVVIAPAGVGVEAVRGGRSAVVLAPASVLELPAANRRLADAGIPWRFTAPAGQGEARLATDAGGDDLSRALENARILEAYGLERQGPGGAADTVLLRLREGSPWVVRGEVSGGGRYLLVASPFSPDASTLPTSSAMLPLLDRLVGAWVSAESAMLEALPGEAVALPADAAEVQRPDGVRDPVAAGGEYRAPGLPGIYQVLAAGRPVSAFAVNPSPAESDLARLDSRGLRATLPGWAVEVVDDADDWGDSVYHRRLGREIWRPLILLVLAVLLVEGLVAASGRSGAVGRPTAAGPINATAPRPRVAASGGGSEASP